MWRRLYPLIKYDAKTIFEFGDLGVKINKLDFIIFVHVIKACVWLLYTFNIMEGMFV